MIRIVVHGRPAPTINAKLRVASAITQMTVVTGSPVIPGHINAS